MGRVYYVQYDVTTYKCGYCGAELAVSRSERGLAPAPRVNFTDSHLPQLPARGAVPPPPGVARQGTADLPELPPARGLDRTTPGCGAGAGLLVEPVQEGGNGFQPEGERFFLAVATVAVVGSFGIALWKAFTYQWPIWMSIRRMRDPVYRAKLASFGFVLDEPAFTPEHVTWRVGQLVNHANLVYSSNGRRLFTWGSNSIPNTPPPTVWNATDGQRLHVLPPSTPSIRFAALSRMTRASAVRIMTTASSFGTSTPGRSALASTDTRSPAASPTRPLACACGPWDTVFP